jgi:xanthine/CO dehydrogenase XdhC/CoxF family maturation factor
MTAVQAGTGPKLIELAVLCHEMAQEVELLRRIIKAICFVVGIMAPLTLSAFVLTLAR